MMMSMLQAGGVEILSDGIRKADEDNPQGYYEFEKVKRLTSHENRDWLSEAQGKAVKVISSFLKYLPPDFTYDVIFMNRDLDEVMASQRRMLVRRGEDPDSQDEDKLCAIFQKHLETTKDWLSRQENFRGIEIIYKEVLENPEKQASRIEVFLGRRLDVPRMVTRVRSELYRNYQ
jgi:hypothetical protein